MKYSLVGVLLIVLFSVIPLTRAQQRGVGVRIRNDRGQLESVNLYDGSYALVIGAINYKSWNKLDGVQDDVPAVRAVLEKLGFNVEVLLDPTGDNLLPRINRFVNDHGFQTNNRLLMYFSGHGYTEIAEDGRKIGYIVPVDAPKPQRDLIGFQQKALTMDEIETVAKRIRSKHVLFVFDSCFSGTLINKGEVKVPSVIDYYAVRPVRQFITAGADNQEVPEESVFRRVLVRGLEGEADTNKDHYITGTELAIYLQEQVVRYRGASQTPQYGKIRDPRLDSGDFIFPLLGAASQIAQAITSADTKLSTDAQDLSRVAQKDATFYYNRARDHRSLGNYDEAIADYTEAIRLNPDNWFFFLSRAFVYSAKNDHERALADYSKAIQLNPKHSDAYSHRGIAFSIKGNYDQAVADYSRAIQLEDDGYTYVDYINRGSAYFRLGKYDQAISDYTETIRRAPDFVSAYRSRADAYEKKGDQALASADRLKADELEKRKVVNGTNAASQSDRTNTFRTTSSYLSLEGTSWELFITSIKDKKGVSRDPMKTPTTVEFLSGGKLRWKYMWQYSGGASGVDESEGTWTQVRDTVHIHIPPQKGGGGYSSITGKIEDSKITLSWNGLSFSIAWEGKRMK